MNQHLTDPEMLLALVSRAMQSLPGATALYVFGSLSDGRGDTYSDVDLTVMTSSPEVSIAARHAVLDRVAPLALEWRIEPSPDTWAATFLFADASPHHKLDLGFAASDRDVDGTLLWRQEPSQSASPGGALASSPFAPASNTVEHHVIGHLLGATRYVKARKRGNDLLCWRFASALLDATLALLYSRECGKPFLGRKLTTSEYLELDGTLSPAVRERLLDRMRLAPAEAMDRSVRSLLDDMLETSADPPFDASIPASLVTQLMAFFDAELGRV